MDASKGSSDIDAPDRTHPVTGVADPLPTLSRTRRRRRWRRQEGQTLVEFVLVFPFFLVVLFGIIEFAFALNAVLSIDFATREAALTAAEAGSEGDADCSILRAVQRSVAAPADNDRITEVRIYKSNTSGDPLGPVNVYVRAGAPISCPLADGTPATLPYHRLSHTYDNRCSILAGCGGSTTVDTIGVQMTYDYDWKTPLHTLLPMAGPGYTMTKANAMRMEPIL